MTGTELELVRRFKSLLTPRLKVYQVIVFGSRARGDADEDSDLDVLVLLDEPETWETLKYVYDCAFDAGLEEGIVISTVVFSRDRWENSPERSSLLALAIRREGIRV